MLLNDAVGPGEIPRPQGIEHHLMVAGGALLLHPGVVAQQIVGTNELALDPVIDLAETPFPACSTSTRWKSRSVRRALTTSSVSLERMHSLARRSSV